MSDFHDLYHIIIEELDNYADNDNIIKDITDKLNSTDLFNQNERLKNKIIKYLKILRNNENNFFENVEELTKLLTERVKLNNKQAENVAIELEDILDPKTVKTLIDYLEHRDANGLNIDDYCGNKISFETLFKAAGLEEEQDQLIPYLLNKRFTTFPACGNGELLFSLMFSNAHRPGGKKDKEAGDVIINNSEKMEVKVGEARLGGQSGYGKGFLASNFIKTKFIKINKNKDISNKIEDLDNLSFNFDNDRITSATNAFLMLCNITAKNNESFDLNDAKEIMLGAFKQVFVDGNAFNEAINISNFTDYLVATESTNNDEHSFENHSSYKKLMNDRTSLNKEIDALTKKQKNDKSNDELKNSIKDLRIKLKDIETKIDELKIKFSTTTKFKIDNSNNQFSNSLLIFALKYYQIVDEFSYFVLANDSEFIILNSDQLDNKDLVINSIKMVSNVSFGDKASDQGGKIKVSLKAK